MMDGAEIDESVWDVVYFASCAMDDVPADARHVSSVGRVPVFLPACWACRIASALANRPHMVALQLRAAFSQSV